MTSVSTRFFGHPSETMPTDGREREEESFIEKQEGLEARARAHPARWNPPSLHRRIVGANSRLAEVAFFVHRSFTANSFTSKRKAGTHFIPGLSVCRSRDSS